MSLNYPIVIVHGIFSRPHKGHWDKPFKKIIKFFNDNGEHAYLAEIDGLGSVETNAVLLDKYIDKILEKEHVQKVNLIGHSKGSLDACYMINKVEGAKDKVASLTSICSPFKGTPLANKFYNWPAWILKTFEKIFNFWYKVGGDKYPDSFKVMRELRINDSLKEDYIHLPQEIYAPSYSGKMTKGSDDILLALPLLWYRSCSKDPCDGCIPIKSTMCGDYKGSVSDINISHIQLMGLNIHGKVKEKVFEFYQKVTDDLKNHGF